MPSSPFFLFKSGGHFVAASKVRQQCSASFVLLLPNFLLVWVALTTLLVCAATAKLIVDPRAQSDYDRNIFDQDNVTGASDFLMMNRRPPNLNSTAKVWFVVLSRENE